MHVEEKVVVQKFRHHLVNVDVINLVDANDVTVAAEEGDEAESSSWH